ncbi:hypothetical protein IWZ03DRAFT_378058 [Phyllosticta citriasiana]|uniref:Secreted protein n=1 Tax=Phyllosticta citriasiana TaxID=595635 RepID=A0ABR1KND8_9PEZI
MTKTKCSRFASAVSLQSCLPACLNAASKHSTTAKAACISPGRRSILASAARNRPLSRATSLRGTDFCAWPELNFASTSPTSLVCERFMSRVRKTDETKKRAKRQKITTSNSTKEAYWRASSPARPGIPGTDAPMFRCWKHAAYRLYTSSTCRAGTGHVLYHNGPFSSSSWSRATNARAARSTRRRLATASRGQQRTG